MTTNDAQPTTGDTAANDARPTIGETTARADVQRKIGETTARARERAGQTAERAGALVDRAAGRIPIVIDRAAGRIPIVTDRAATAIDVSARALNESSDETLTIGAAFSAGVALGLYAGGANRVLVTLMLVPALAMAAALLTRRGRTSPAGSPGTG